MNTTLTAFTANTGWNMLKKAGQNRYYLFAPANLKGELRNVLTDVIGYLLADKHVSMLAEAKQPNVLNSVRAISRETRVLKRGETTALFAELEHAPSAEMLRLLPHTGLSSVRFAGFHELVPSELHFSGIIDANCPSDIVLDFTHISGRLAIGISFNPEKMDECVLVQQVRQAVQDCGECLHIYFAS